MNKQENQLFNKKSVRKISSASNKNFARACQLIDMMLIRVVKVSSTAITRLLL